MTCRVSIAQYLYTFKGLDFEKIPPKILKKRGPKIGTPSKKKGKKYPKKDKQAI